MKKVLIIQRTSYFDDIISKLVTTDDIEIVGITASSDIQKNQITSYYPNIPVFTHQEIYNWTKSFVTQSDIQTYYQTQLKVERNYFRIFKGSAYIMSIYYSSLAFWLNLFNNPIDCVIVREIEHGSPIDSIPMDIAKKRNIPVFNIEVVSEQTTRSLWGIRSYNSEKYVNLSELDEKLPKLDVQSYLFSAQSIKLKENGKYNHQAKINNTFSGLFTLRKKFISENNINLLWVLLRIIYNWFYTLGLKFYYHSKATKYIDNNEKYIIYPLHLEPEASILNRTIYNSQIYNIKMLSTALPKGWKLYVKEHPHQFSLFTPKRLTHLLEWIPNFRNIAYYQELLSLNNVVLLNENVNLKSIFFDKNHELFGKNGLMAIATINGTVSLEAIYAKIPVILFAHNTTPAGQIPGTFSITCYEDIERIINNLSNSLDYNNDSLNQILSSYLFLMTDEDGYQISDKALQTLVYQANQYI